MVLGIWIAKLLSPFKLLLTDMALAMVAGIGLVTLADTSSNALWGFTVLLGLSMATVSGAIVAWTVNSLPGICHQLLFNCSLALIATLPFYFIQQSLISKSVFSKDFGYSHICSFSFNVNESFSFCANQSGN